MRRKIFKYNLIVLTLLFFSAGLMAQKQKHDLSTAIGYMGVISDERGSITEDMMSYVSASAHSRREKKIDKKRKELIKTMLAAKFKIKRLPDFKGDGTYRDAVVKYMETSFKIMNEDYEELVDMEEVAQESYDAMEAYLLTKEKADEKKEEAYVAFREAKLEFALKNNINLVASDSKFSDKVEKSNEVIRYKNKVYLIYFKSYKERTYLSAGIKAGDLSVMEQRKNSLSKFSKEGLSKLKELGAFDGDDSYIKACENLLQYYISEVEEAIPQLENFFLTKETFGQVKAAYQNKRSSDRTQADVDLYNKSIEDYNNAINTFNAVNESSFEKRSKAFNAYNRASDKFVDKHTPKFR